MNKGFTCECGKFHEFGVWVAAHWNEPLTHTCECRRIHDVRSGVVRLKRRVPKPKAERPE